MANTETLSVTLPTALLAQMREAVAEGTYASSDALVSDALQEWQTKRVLDSVGTDELRRMVQEAEEDDSPEVPMDEVMDRLEAKYRALAVKAGVDA